MNTVLLASLKVEMVVEGRGKSVCNVAKDIA